MLVCLENFIEINAWASHPRAFFLRVVSGILTTGLTVFMLSFSVKPILTRRTRTERILICLWPLAHTLVAVL